jgi:5'-nucleotidase
MQTRTRKALWVLLLFCFAMPAAAQQAPAPSAFTVLLTNDDGYEAPGLKAMIEAFRSAGDVYVVAPAENQSGKGHSITTSEVIMVYERKQPNGATWYGVDAPPATCARLAIESLLPKRPDLVISGINRGENLGVVVYYSGTLGAAREAAIVGIPAIAVSMSGNKPEDYAATAAYLRGLVDRLREKQMLKPGFFLNVNAPAGAPKGAVVTRLSTKAPVEKYDGRRTPYGRPYFWSSWQPLRDDDEGTDVWAFARGFITLTPMLLDVTDQTSLEPLRAFEKKPTPAAK